MAGLAAPGLGARGAGRGHLRALTTAGKRLRVPLSLPLGGVSWGRRVLSEPQGRAWPHRGSKC